MKKNEKLIKVFFIFTVCLISFLGCEKAEVSAIQNTKGQRQEASSTENPTPDEPDVQMQSVEERIFIKMGLKIPFDYTSEENVLKNDFVVILENGEALNRNFFTKFYGDYQNGADGSVIIVNYADDKPDSRCAILFENGRLECELIKNGESAFFDLSDIYNDDEGVYGVLENGESVLLTMDFICSEGTEPVPAELSGKLEWAFGAENGEISWYIANTIYEMNGVQKDNLGREQTEEMLNLLLSEPIYYFNDVEEKTVETPLDVRITIKSPQNDMYITPQNNGSILIGIDGIRYVSFSETFFNKMLSLINMDVFDISSIDKVDSISIYYPDSENNVQNKQITDPGTIINLVQSLKACSAGMSRSGFKPSAQIILHTANDDIKCSLYLKSMPEEPDREIVINDFYWYYSQETVDIIRDLFD